LQLTTFAGEPSRQQVCTPTDATAGVPNAVNWRGRGAGEAAVDERRAAGQVDVGDDATTASTTSGSTGTMLGTATVTRGPRGCGPVVESQRDAQFGRRHPRGGRGE
jgi:hypothetical protein